MNQLTFVTLLILLFPFIALSETIYMHIFECNHVWGDAWVDSTIHRKQISFGHIFLAKIVASIG